MKSNAMIQNEIPELLRILSRKTLEDMYLGSVNGSDIYQLQQGWQREIIAADPAVCVVMNTTDFEQAVISPDVSSIFVPHNAVITQELVERILLRNPLSKTVYWEVNSGKNAG